MSMPSTERIFDISNEQEFEVLALEIFRYQSHANPVYSEYIKLLGISPGSVNKIDEIPFLPVGFFRDHKVISGGAKPEIVFESSGTTSTVASRHYVADKELYRESFLKGFELFYGIPEDYCILALLPSYLEREHSSLVYMTGELIRMSGHPDSDFYLDNIDSLVGKLRDLEKSGEKSILLGVSFALADLADNHPMKLQNTIIMETGGMKGRRKEMTREELHGILTEGFGISSIHSEYGMTELLSQAWSKSEGVFRCPPWMKIIIRDPYDPLSVLDRESSGGINIIDLANIHSCSFIATQDIGRLNRAGDFEILGRFDDSDIRGCNLLVS